MSALRQVLFSDAEFKSLDAAEKAALEIAGISMDFIMPALFVGHRLGFAGDELAVSALGRMMGWIAHAMEKFHHHALARPRTTYVGPLPNSS